MMWMEFECETSLIAKTPETRQHFFHFFGVGCGVRVRVYRIFGEMTSFFFAFFLGLRRSILAASPKAMRGRIARRKALRAKCVGEAVVFRPADPIPERCWILAGGANHRWLV